MLRLQGHGKTVYPRGCGGTQVGFLCLIGTQGLSPRVRGNQSKMRIPAGALGSIPAGAGEPPRSLGLA